MLRAAAMLGSMLIIPLTPAQQHIEQLAKQLGISKTTVQGWRARGCVAHRYRLPLLEAAKAQGVPLDPADFDRLTRWWQHIDAAEA